MDYKKKIEKAISDFQAQKKRDEVRILNCSHSKKEKQKTHGMWTCYHKKMLIFNYLSQESRQVNQGETLAEYHDGLNSAVVLVSSEFQRKMKIVTM